MKSKEITIRIDDTLRFTQEGQNFVFKAEAEAAILELLTLKEKIEAALEEVKQGIGRAGRQISPDFKGVIGARVKAIYRTSGERYEYDQNKQNQLAPFLKTISFQKVDAEKVDAHLAQGQPLPEGINLKKRLAAISLRLIPPQLENG